MKVILASKSEQRQDLLKMIGLKYEVMVSDEAEDSDKTNPDDYVVDLSLNKAKAVSNKTTEKAIIIAADTIIYKDGKFYEKPRTKEEAFNNIKEMSDSINYGITGVTILDLYQNKMVSFSNKVEVKFRKITDDEINWYVNNENKIFSRCGYVPLGKASLFMERVNGDYNSLFGLPISEVFVKLMELGYEISDFDFE